MINDHDSVHIDITYCARCGTDHIKLEFKKFINSIVDSDGLWSFWSLCPITEEPILMRMIEYEKR